MIEGLVGKANYRDQSISLDRSVARPQALEQAYLHELIHWILFMMNKDGLRKDEDFVDTFAHFLYQAHQMQDMEEIASNSEELKEQEIYKRKLYDNIAHEPPTYAKSAESLNLFYNFSELPSGTYVTRILNIADFENKMPSGEENGVIRFKLVLADGMNATLDRYYFDKSSIEKIKQIFDAAYPEHENIEDDDARFSALSGRELILQIREDRSIIALKGEIPKSVPRRYAAPYQKVT